MMTDLPFMGTGNDCPCVREHNPNALVIETHHILPLSWGGTNDVSNKIRVCAQTHYAIHFILNAFVRAKEIGPRQSGWPHFAYTYAVTAWSDHEASSPGHPTPFWLPESHPLSFTASKLNPNTLNHDDPVLAHIEKFMGWD